MQYSKIKILFVGLMLQSIILGADASSKVDVETDEATIDFTNEQFSADGGVKFIYPNSDPEKTAKIKAYELSKIPNKNLILANNGVIFEQGENKVEASEILFNMDDISLRIRNGVSYVKVEKAPEGNDKIYYGGEEFLAKFPNEAFVKNAWFTTSKKALKMTEKGIDPGDILPYHMKAKKIAVYPGKKLVAYNTFLYVRSIPVLWLPWYASSLKADTQAPLFPLIGASTDEGTYLIWGIDYGNEENNYINGSIALRTSSKKGLYIDNWENVYKINGNENNKGSLMLEDGLILPKGESETEYKFTYGHNYKGEHGELKLEYIDQTTNTINEDDYEEGDDITETKLKRLELSTDLNRLGPSQDISLVSNIQYISNKEIIQKMVEKASEDSSNDDKLDNDIKSNVKLTKDNRKYKLYLKYDYLDDIDPGSSTTDTQSSVDDQEYSVELKKYKIYVRYIDSQNDTWRYLTSTEREDEDGTDLNDKKGSWADSYSYNPYTVKSYDTVEEKNDLKLGPYAIFRTGFNLSTEYHKSSTEKTLDRTIDPFSGDEYNDNESKLYEKEENENYVLTLSQSTRMLSVETGTETEEYIKRSTTGDDGEKFTNESSYNDFKISDSKINLYKLGTLNLSLSRREDEFVEKDILTKDVIGAKHNVTLYNNSGKYLRYADLKLVNNLGFDWTQYSHDAGSYDYLSSDAISRVGNDDDLAKYRLDNKSNILNYNDSLSFDFGNTTTIYTYKIGNEYDSYDKDWQTDKDTTNQIEFKVNNKKTLLWSLVENIDYFKNDNDENAGSNYYNKNNEYPLDEDYKKTTWELADDRQSFTFSKSNKMEYEWNTKSISDWEHLANQTVTYGDMRTKESTQENSYTYGFGKENEPKTTLTYTTTENYIYNNSSKKNTTETYKKKYEVQYSFGDEKSYLVKLGYATALDSITDLNNRKTYIVKYEYKNKNPKNEERKLEENISDDKYKLSMTQEEIDALEEKYDKKIREERGLGFDIMGLGADDKPSSNEISWTLYAEATTNEKYLEYSKDFVNSVEEFQIRAAVKYNKFQLSYKYDQDIDFTKNSTELYGIKRDLNEKTHELNLNTKFGETSYQWKFDGGIVFNSEIENELTERKLESWKASIGKEFDYYEVSLSYEKEWDETDREYDWTAKFRIALTTFPNKGIGFGNNYEDGEQTNEFETGI